VPGLVQLGHLSSFFKHALEKHDWCVSILKQIWIPSPHPLSLQVNWWNSSKILLCGWTTWVRVSIITWFTCLG